jgi:hypothetical protein
MTCTSHRRTTTSSVTLVRALFPQSPPHAHVHNQIRVLSLTISFLNPVDRSIYGTSIKIPGSH